MALLEEWILKKWMAFWRVGRWIGRSILSPFKYTFQYAKNRILIVGCGLGRGFWDRFLDPQPAYSAYREPSFGHAELAIESDTEASYTWCGFTPMLSCRSCIAPSSYFSRFASNRIGFVSVSYGMRNCLRRCVESHNNSVSTLVAFTFEPRILFSPRAIVPFSSFICLVGDSRQINSDLCGVL